MVTRSLEAVLLGLVTLFFTMQSLADGKESVKDSTHSKAREFEVKVDKSADIVRITVMGLSGYHCNTLYPWRLTVKEATKEDKVYKKEDAKKFSSETVVFEVGRAKGQEAKLKLSMCNDTQCIMHEESMSW